MAQDTASVRKCLWKRCIWSPSGMKAKPQMDVLHCHLLYHILNTAFWMAQDMASGGQRLSRWWRTWSSSDLKSILKSTSNITTHWTQSEHHVPDGSRRDQWQSQSLSRWWTWWQSELAYSRMPDNCQSLFYPSTATHIHCESSCLFRP